jgi:hypothetical protein
MRTPRLAVPALLASAVLAAACSDVSPLTEPVSFQEEVSLFGDSPLRGGDAEAFGLDAEFLRIAREHPGFGGFFYGEDGALNIVTTGVQPMSSRLATSLARIGVDPTAQPVRVVQGQYDFVQLNAMHRQVKPVLSIKGVVYTDADERTNRVVVGVEDAQARSAVEQAIAMAGLPNGAVEIRDAEPIVPMQTLQSRVRPVGGGLQIDFPLFPCTLGFNVRSPQYPNVHGFVTASHCTNYEYGSGPVGTPYWQPSSGVPDNFIGTEVHDVPPFTGGACPAGHVCRWSDVAGIRYESGVDDALGVLWRTTGPGSLTIDQANPNWIITEERPFPFVGDIANKVGRTTGWSQGSVILTCIDATYSEPIPFKILCQDAFSATVWFGDSGSPVFQFQPGSTTNVRLLGILWAMGDSEGTIGIFSAMENIRFENQGPSPWITYPGQTPPVN